MKAIWNNTVIAESDDTVVVEGNHYFPRSAVNSDYLQENDRESFCPWKGMASYYDIKVNGDTNPAAAWYYATPKKAAENITDHIAFWCGVSVEK